MGNEAREWALAASSQFGNTLNVRGFPAPMPVEPFADQARLTDRM
jgi:hypothetical protein